MFVKQVKNNLQQTQQKHDNQHLKYKIAIFNLLLYLEFRNF